MEDTGKALLVSKIREGTVIDHIPAGHALDVLKILGLTGKEGFIICVAMNVPSRKLGRKDIVKVESKELSKEEVDKIALIAPTATINVIRDYAVVEKHKVSLPDEVVNIVKCINPTCISNDPREPVAPRFHVIQRNPPLLKCQYCGRYLSLEDILSQC